MLMVERTIRSMYPKELSGLRMPTKGKALFISSPYLPSGVGIWWTDKKSSEGKRLFNVGCVRVNGEEPEFFRL